VKNISLVNFLNSVWNIVLFIRGHRHTHYNLMELPKERKNCTLTELVNVMLDTVGLSKEW
jgi:hypothetical protein